jgi:hypothetical protein
MPPPERSNVAEPGWGELRVRVLIGNEYYNNQIKSIVAAPTAEDSIISRHSADSNCNALS